MGVRRNNESMPIYANLLLRWLELADIALGRKPKPTTPAIIEDLPSDLRNLANRPQSAL